MTMFRRADPCAHYRPSLTDWVERQAEGPLTREAFDHLERCRRCEAEITTLAQTVIALRRLGARAATAEPPLDGWRDLRTRLEASRKPSRSAGRWRWAWTGSMLGPAVVAILALRIAFVPVVPATDLPTHDAPAAASTTTDLTRPMYDSGSQRLTEAIVLLLAGPALAGEINSTSSVTVPSSTDRRDLPPPARRALAPSEPTPPRTAIRS
jgi:hypothetical protein